jgi:uncharacterized delta-60 repeat protein
MCLACGNIQIDRAGTNVTLASRGSWIQRHLTLLGACIAALVVLASAASPALGKTGGLDRGFSENGRVIGAAYTSFVDMATLADGHIVVATESALYAYRPNGRPAGGFGDNGTVDPLSPEGAPVTIEDLAVDGHGRILVVGSASHPFPAANYGSFAMIERYLPTGELDGGFGRNGIVFTDLGLPPPARLPGIPADAQVPTAPEVRALGVAVDSRERIAFSGTRAATYVGTKSLPTLAPVREAFVARLTEAGNSDPSFGGSGTTSLGELSSIGQPAVDSRDGVYFVARRQPALEFAELPGPNVVGHLDASGSVDPNFGKHGWRALTDDSSESDLDITLDRKGRLLIPGQGSSASIECLKPNGSLDRRFGHDGIATIAHPNGEVKISDLAVTRAGKILATGVLITETKPSRNGPIWRILLARLSRRGRLDTRFGEQGTVITRFGKESAAQGQAVIAERNGRALVGGSDNNGPGRFVLARYVLSG